jgi:nicotinamidase-related amidase
MKIKIIKIKQNNTGLLFIDLQVNLIKVMTDTNAVIENVKILSHLADLYDLPLILTEQFPKWLGPTNSELVNVLPLYQPVVKMEFDCCLANLFIDQLASDKWSDVENIILAGAETHICVLQTGLSLLEKGYNVHIMADAVTSRTQENKHIGLELLKQAGAIISCTETAVFQIMQKAGSKEFKQMLKLIK